MDIQIKNLRTMESLSEETLCYSATVYVDGVRAFTASNRGHGGCDDYRHVSEVGKGLLEQAEKYAKALPPKLSDKYPPLEYDLELLIGDLISDKLEEKQLKSWCRNKIVIKKNDAPKGSYVTISQKFQTSFVPKLNERYPNSEIVNLRFA